MKFHYARQVIHDAFMPDSGPVDVSGVRVQVSVKGSSDKTADHCDKGKIQHALEKILKAQDGLAWAWNMYAYTPPGHGHGFERTAILQHLMGRYIERGYGNPYLDSTGAPERLARIAMEDIKFEEWNRTRKRRKYADLGRAVGLDAETYKRERHRHYVFFRGELQKLPERSLPLIASIIWMILDKESEDPIEARSASEDLNRALKMPVGGVV